MTLQKMAREKKRQKQMARLRELNQVAYVRFSSVYREFTDISQFLDALGPMLDRGNGGES